MARGAEFSHVLVVIPCLNEMPHLKEIVAQVLQDTPGARVVVADGGSTDGSREAVVRMAQSEPRLCLLNNRKRIQSAAINAAVEKFGGEAEWLVRIDAHCRYPHRFVERLISAATRTGAASVTVPMRTVGVGLFQSAVAIAQNSRLGTGGAAHRTAGAGGFVDHGHHALFALKCFREAGGYCEQMSHNEDAELDIRIASQGGRIWLEPSLAIEYFPRTAPLPLLRQYFNYGAGRARTSARHGQPLKLRQLLPLAVAPAVCLLAVGLFLPILLVPAAAWAALCLSWGGWLAFGSRSGAALLAGPAAMIMHLGWSAGFWWQRLGSAGESRLDWCSRLRFSKS